MAWKTKRKRIKHGAIRQEVDGIKFASKAEAKRYCYLRWLQKGGHISELECHPKVDLTPPLGEKKRRHTWTLDFTYVEDGTRYWEDVKGASTAKLREFVVNCRIWTWMGPGPLRLTSWEAKPKRWTCWETVPGQDGRDD